MNLTILRNPLRRFCRVASLAAVTWMAASASAAEKSYRYFRFETTRVWNDNANMQMAEFTFSHNGTVINTNNRDGSGVGVVPVTITSGAQDPNAGEGPAKVGDGDTGTKWFKGNPFGEAEALTFDFGSTVTIDAYNWASANDSVEYSRNPVSWNFAGSADGVTWDLLDARINYPIQNENFTYQAGFTIPDEILPAVVLFKLYNSGFEGTAGIVTNGTPIGLEWDTLYSDEVSISPSPGAVDPFGIDTEIIPPADATTTYTITAGRAGVVDTSTASVTVRSVAGGEETYRYVRFKATKLRSGLGTGLIQLGEFSFSNDGSPVAVTAVESPGGNTPETDTISYLDFSAVGDELSLTGTTQIFGDVLRLTEDIGGQRGEAWFRYKQPVANGFEATFKMSMNQDAPNGFVPADGLAFVIQNSAEGSDSGSLGEGGVPTNALNIKFKSFGFDGGEASQIQVLAGTTVLGTTSAFHTPGVVLTGVPGHPYTLGTVAGADPYQIRVVYVPGAPGHVDVYLDGIAVLQNVEVDLADIGAVDASGEAWVGFTARTGGNVQNNDIIDWKMGYGDFSALPPFGAVRSIVRDLDDGTTVTRVVDLVWNAEESGLYNVTRSGNLAVWDIHLEQLGVAGQIGVRINLDPVETTPREFFRVEEVE